MIASVVATRRATAAARPRGALVDADIRLLANLADAQLRYGQAEEALILLRLCQAARPGDQEIRYKLARVLTAMEEYEAAETLLDSLDEAGPRALLARAWCLWGLARASEAAKAFETYLSLKRREQAA